MKKSGWASVLLSAACAALALFGQSGGGGADMASVLSLPFVWAGSGLRALSLSGVFGNMLAIFMYVLISLLPVWPLVRKSLRPKGSFLKLLLAFASAYLFFLLYFMVNPSLIKTLFRAAAAGSQEMLAAVQSVLCLFFYSLLFAYWLACVMTDTDRLAYRLRQLLYVLGAAMIFSVFYVNLAGLKGSLASPPAAPGSEIPFGWDMNMPNIPETYPFCDGLIAVLRFVFFSVPSILLLTALPTAMRLLLSLEKNFFSEENQRLAAAIAGRCRLSVLISISGMLAMGALQLLLAGYLSNVDLSGSAPLIVLTVSLAMMLLSRYLERSFAVYRENQMMI